MTTSASVPAMPSAVLTCSSSLSSIAPILGDPQDECVARRVVDERAHVLLLDRGAGGLDPGDHLVAGGRVRENDRRVPEGRRPGRRWRSAGALPRVRADVVVV